MIIVILSILGSHAMRRLRNEMISGILLLDMRYRPEHKAEIHRKIVKDASRRVRSEGLGGAAVAAVMRDTGLTHGGFYKHFKSKDELLVQSVQEAFQEFGDTLVAAAEESHSQAGWKEIVKTYLSREYCEHADRGCPLTALSPELARSGKRMRSQIFTELVKYKDKVLPFMPGQRTSEKERAFFVIFSTMVGAVEIARMLPDGTAREKVLASARSFLFSSF